MPTAQQVATGAVCYQCIADKLSAVIYLLNTGGKTVSQIEADAVTTQNVADKKAASIFLLSSGSTPAEVSSGSATFQGNGQFLASLIYVLNINNLTVPQIAAGAACYAGLQNKWACIVSLLNTSGYTAAQIASGSACYQCLEAKDAAILSLAASGSTPPASNGLLNGLVAYWKFNEASNVTRMDSTGNGWNLEDYSATVAGVAGFISNAVDFNGASGGLRVTGLSPQPTSSTAWSVSVWVYIPSGGSSVAVFYQDGVCQFGSNQNNLSGAVYFFTDGNSCLIDAENAIPNDTWTHVCFVRGSGVVTLYVNGVPFFTSTVSGNWFDVGWPLELEVGYGENSGSPSYVGTDFKQDESACWSLALTPTQVSQLYNDGLGLTYENFTT